MPREYYSEQRQYSSKYHDRSLDPEFDARNYRASMTQSSSHSFSRNADRYEVREYESRRSSSRQYPADREVALTRDYRDGKSYKEKEAYYEHDERGYYENRDTYSSTRNEYVAEDPDYYAQQRSKRKKQKHKRKHSREHDHHSKKLHKQRSLVADYESDSEYTGSSKGTPTQGLGLGPSRVTPELERSRRSKSPSTALSDYSNTKLKYEPVSRDNSPDGSLDYAPRRTNKDSRHLYHSPNSRYSKEPIHVTADIRESRKTTMKGEHYDYYEKPDKKDKYKYDQKRVKEVPLKSYSSRSARAESHSPSPKKVRVYRSRSKSPQGFYRGRSPSSPYSK
ncbi:hypothetical protein LSH36_544g06012 [Paralvinella palmiformis]|uniref:Uncharacterized protein n=1 Tax=Paralvinella palmiformis TaxID=53620 RepID=A0AAD9J6Y1_9ANNE|nr:hypothetical protein LSH36_544g06012 [Paralvinella palmiformis]